MRFCEALMALAVALAPLTVNGQGLPSNPASNNPSDADIREAVTALELADGYRDILAATMRYEDVIGSPRMVELIDGVLKSASLDDNQRGLLGLERQLSLDCRLLGATVAARLLAVRLVAGYALLADSPAQFAVVLGKFSPLEKEINAQLVREALDTPGNSWPGALLLLMRQLARDWPALGPDAAATRMAESAQSAGQMPSDQASSGRTSSGPTPAPARGQTLAGHWRKTSIVFDNPQDEHLVLGSDGAAETWTVTASSRTPTMRGRWNSQGATLRIDWADGSQWSQPFTFFEGQLVFPNIADRRQFWELVD